jgi:dienelactone hydrolase
VRPTASPLAVLAVLAVLLPAPAAATAEGSARDPLALGDRQVEVIDYDAGATLVVGELMQPYPTERRGRIYLPEPAAGAALAAPVVLLLHGRHPTCSTGGLEIWLHPCPETVATTDIRSHTGYDDLGRNLASHGYLVVSISANGINTFDITSAVRGAGTEERAQIVAKTLDLLAAWHTGPGPGDVGRRLVGRVDLSRIGLVGHSRGGDGVTEFIAANRTRTDGPRYPGLRAVLALAGTDFKDHVPTGVHFATLLPLCDGDVADQQGADAYERGRFADPDTPFARHQFAVEGANHNWFNTVWEADTPDDNRDVAGACADDAPTRLSAAAQRRVGVALIGAFLRTAVGGEAGFEDLLTGRVGLADAVVRTTALAPAADRVLLLEPRDDEVIRTSGGASASRCRGRGGDANRASPRPCPTTPNRSIAEQVTLAWEGPGTMAVDLGAPVDMSAFDELTLRAAVNHTVAANDGVAEQDLDVVLVDAAGRRAAAPLAGRGPALRPAADSTLRHVILGGIRVPMEELDAVDLTRVVRVELIVGERTPTGSIQLAELAVQR